MKKIEKENNDLIHSHYRTTEKGETALIKYYNLINNFFELDHHKK